MSDFVNSLMANGGTGDSAGATPMPTDYGSNASMLSDLRSGSTVLSALSAYGAGRAREFQDKLNAGNEVMAGTGELIDAQQKSNAIQQNYNQTVADQLAVASASGYDVSSGSVVTARGYAERQATTQQNIVQTNGILQARLRQARANAFLAQAQQDKTAGIVSAVTDIFKGVTDAAMMGG